LARLPARVVRMGGNGFVLLLVLSLFSGAAILALRAASAMDRGRQKIIRVDRQISAINADREDRIRIRDRAAELVRMSTQTVQELETALAQTEAELQALRNRPPTLMHLLSRRVEPTWPIYRGTVTAPHGFAQEDGLVLPDGATPPADAPAEQRVYAAPAPDMAGFQAEMARRFPAEAGFELGPVSLFMPASPGAKPLLRRSGPY
jgi:hypothetical protein